MLKIKDPNKSEKVNSQEAENQQQVLYKTYAYTPQQSQSRNLPVPSPSVCRWLPTEKIGT